MTAAPRVTASTGGSGIQAPAIAGPAMPPARPDREAEARKEAGVGIGLADDLRAIRTALVKAHLVEDFQAAFDLMLFQMGRAVFTPAYRDDALDIAVRETPDRPPLRVNDDAFGDWNPGEAMLADRSSLRFDWLEIEDRQESFAALRALPDESMRVRRLVADDGEHLIGRVLGPAELTEFRGALGLDGGPGLTAAEVHDEIMVRGASFPLANGWKLARRRLMGADRIEIEGPADGDTAALKRMGCIAEIVSWRTRLFAPDTATLERIVERWPIAASAAA